MKGWIENLHVGQLIILIVALAFLAGCGWVGAILSDEAATTASYELQRSGGPVSEGEVQTDDPIEDFVRNQGRRRLERRVERFQVLFWVSLGVIPLSGLAAGGVLWVWFGGRKKEGLRMHGR